MIGQYPQANNSTTTLIWRKTMSGGETSLSGYDDGSSVLSYTPGQEQVYLNGILLLRGSDYTATDGTSITGISALAASDVVQVNAYNNFNLTTSLPASNIYGTITNNQLSNSSITINGTPVSLGGSVTIDALPPQSGNSGKYLKTNGSSATWETVNSYLAPTIGSTLISSGSTITTIEGLSLSGSSNTFSNIPNSALTNSSITINGSAVSLGGSTTISTSGDSDQIILALQVFR